MLDNAWRQFIPAYYSMLAVVAVLTVILICTVARIWRRARVKIRGQVRIFAAAQRRADDTGKPLVVFGDPVAPHTFNSWFGAGYGCGDLCVDANGAPSCPPGRRERALILDWLLGQPDDSAVIFESEVLLYVPERELRRMVDEMFRVSGGDLFSSHSNAVDVEAYAVTGERQPVRGLDLLIMKPRTRITGVKRVFTAYPPFAGGYEWIEFYGTPSRA